MDTRKLEEQGKQRLIELSNGMIVEQDVLNIIGRIQKYDPNLVVQYSDPDKSDIFDAPYRIMENCPDGLQRMVMACWALDERVIERLFAADTQRHKILEGIDNRNHMVLAGIKRRYNDEQKALSEMVQGVLRSHKDTYTATNPVTGEHHTFRSLRKSKD